MENFVVHIEWVEELCYIVRHKDNLRGFHSHCLRPPTPLRAVFVPAGWVR